MARPQTKKDLLEQSTKNHDKLMAFINSLSEEEQRKEFPEGTMNRNISDVLAHLHEWHNMVLNWYEVGMRGDTPDIPAKGYNWRQIPALNREIWERYSQTDLEETKRLFSQTHQAMMDIVEGHSNEELFERARYPWTGNNAMGAYFVSATASHYDWGLKLMKKARKKMLELARA